MTKRVTNLKRAFEEMSSIVDEQDQKKGSFYRRQEPDPYPSLTRRAVAVRDALDPFCGNQQIPVQIAQTISEYSLLPLSWGNATIEEKKLFPNGSNLQSLPQMPRFSPLNGRILLRPGIYMEACYIQWITSADITSDWSFARPVCRLVVLVDLINRLHVADNCPRRTTVSVNPAFASDLVAWDLYREDPCGSTDLGVASLSFYYREFLAMRCQCGMPTCPARPK